MTNFQFGETCLLFVCGEFCRKRKLQDEFELFDALRLSLNSHGKAMDSFYQLLTQTQTNHGLDS